MESLTCSSAKMCLYAENKNRYGTEKKRNGNFNKALKEIEEAIRKDGGLITEHTPDMDTEQTLCKQKLIDSAPATKFSSSENSNKGFTFYSGKNSYKKNKIACREIISPIARPKMIKALTNNQVLRNAQPKNHIVPELAPYKDCSGKMDEQKTDCKKLTERNVQTNTEEKLSVCLSLLELKWVPDDVIHLYFSILSSKIVDSSICLLSPTITQALKCLVDFDLETHLLPLQLDKREVIIIPVSDSPAILEEGGSHWSLLIYLREQETFLYMDSMSVYNYKHAEKIAIKLYPYFYPSKPISILKVQVPQQSNSIDCGIYMILFAEVVIQHITKSGDVKNITSVEGIFPDIDEALVLTKRAQIALLLLNNQHLMLKAATIESMMSTTKEKSGLIGEVPISMDSVSDDQTVSTNVVQRAWSGYNNVTEHLKTINKHVVLELNDPGISYRAGDLRPSLVSTQTATKKAFSCRREHSEGSDLSGEERVINADTALNSVMKLVQCRKPNHTSGHNSVMNKARSKGEFSSRKLTVMADSQGRELTGFLEKCTGERVSVFGHIQPGAPLEAILATAEEEIKFNDFSSQDCLILIGGTNNVANNTFMQHPLNTQTFTNYMDGCVKMFEKTNLILSTIPYRYDLNESDLRNTLIKKINAEIREITYRYSCVHLLDLYLLERRYHTKHGLHINRRGKKRIAEQIGQLLEAIHEQSSGVTSRKRNADGTVEQAPNLQTPVETTSSTSSNNTKRVATSVVGLPVGSIQVPERMETGVDVQPATTSVSFIETPAGLPFERSIPAPSVQLSYTSLTSASTSGIQSNLCPVENSCENFLDISNTHVITLL